MNTIRLFLVDDEPNVRQGLRMRLEMEPDFRVVGEAGDACAALAAVAEVLPDVVLMDVDMPGKDGIRATAELRCRAPACAVIVVSMQDDPGTRARAGAAGAVAFVGKHDSDAVLTDAIRSAVAGSGAERASEWIAGTSDDVHGQAAGAASGP